jgi:hypothetical protein
MGRETQYGETSWMSIYFCKMSAFPRVKYDFHEFPCVVSLDDFSRVFLAGPLELFEHFQSIFHSDEKKKEEKKLLYFTSVRVTQFGCWPVPAMTYL